MARVDFTPLFRTSIGFDRLADVFDRAMQREESGFPPYDIERCGPDAYRIVMAVAGFEKDDLKIVVEQSRLKIQGRIEERPARHFLHRGIATRSFQRCFDLADFVEVQGVMMRDGLLVIDLKRELPGELKPRQIEIQMAECRDAEADRLARTAA
jgi:molecular chaperone IbpA